MEVWAADEPEARLTAHDMTCPGKPTVATRMISESGVLLCTECAGNGFRLGTDWNVDTVEEAEKLWPHVPMTDCGNERQVDQPCPFDTRPPTETVDRRLLECLLRVEAGRNLTKTGDTLGG